jgi:hypothetical protein
MNEVIELIAKTYGIVGVLILLPVVSTVWLALESRRIQKDKSAIEKALTEKLESVHNQRVEDAKAISGKLMEMASETSSLSKETNIVLHRISEQIENALRRR